MIVCWCYAGPFILRSFFFVSGRIASGAFTLDHTLSLPILRAVADKHGPVALIHVDAHADINEHMFGEVRKWACEACHRISPRLLCCCDLSRLLC